VSRIGRTRRKVARGLAVGLALALPASAGAAEPFTVDSGGVKPHVAVGEDRTGHFVWEDADETAIAYCQVQRGGRACTRSQRWMGVEGMDIEGPRVLLHPDGRIIIIAERVCDRVALVSEDGGATFSEPTAISSGCLGTDEGFRAELGPGEDTVSYLHGGLFKAVPLSGPATVGHTRLGPGFQSGLAFVDRLTPIVALSDLDEISFRVYHGAGDYNDASNWTPAKPVGSGDEPDLAGGLRGVYLSYETPSGRVISRYDREAGEFGEFEPPQQISEGVGETNFSDLHQSASGSLHQTWTRPGSSPLEQRRSLDGVNWLPTETLADDEGGARDFFHQQLATAGDGGGFAVWDDYADGDVRAVEIATNDSVVPEPPELCRVRVGIAVAIAREGCFERQGSLYTAPGEVRINGIDLSGPGKVRSTP
jgi:hypothetical protein